MEGTATETLSQQRKYQTNAERLRESLEQLSEHPHCRIPPHFFEHKIALTERGDRRRTMLSVQTWDGRTVVEVESGNEW